MRPYEVMVIFDIDLEEGDIRQRVERVHELVRSKGGTPGSVSHWGRRTFAYEIKHRSEGYYVVLEATAEPAAMSEVDRFLALEDAVLRHKVIRQPDNVAGRPATKQRRRSAPAPRGGAPRSAGSSAVAAAPTAPTVPADPIAGGHGEGEAGAVEGGAGGAAPIAAGAAENSGTDTGTVDPSGDAEPTPG
jgi:small subunit ribosomal protein S6